MPIDGEEFWGEVFFRGENSLARVAVNDGKPDEAGEQMQRVDGSNHVEENAKGVLWRKKPCLRKLRPSDKLANQKQQPQKEGGKHEIQKLNLLVAANHQQSFLHSETTNEQN